MKIPNSRDRGQQIERLAGLYLFQRGAEPLLYNYRCCLGEMDIIAKQASWLLFVEVRYRKSLDYGGPSASVNWPKQQRLVKIAQYFLKTHSWTKNLDPRLDVVTVHGPMNNLQFEWLPNAIEVN